jgi:hypothetical protein
MPPVIKILQIVIALGLLNVWLVRSKVETPYRGGGAKTLWEEFRVYGLPSWSFFLVGVCKVGLALLLLIGVWVPSLTAPAAAGIVFLMAVAVAMHAKVGDPIRKAAPAAFMFVCASVVALV